MGQFFSGNMVGGDIRMLNLPVLPNATVKYATLGTALIQAEIPAVVSVGSRSVSLWDEFHPLKRYIAYIDDAGLVGSFLAAAQITERKLSPDGSTIRITAEGISEYLKNRYFEDGTIDFYDDVDGSLGGLSLKDQTFNPTARVASSWLDHTLDQLALRSVYFDPTLIYGGTRDLTVPITYSSIGNGHGTGGSRQWPYNAVKELISVWDRLNMVIQSDLDSWTVRPTLNGQTSTSMTTALHAGTSDTIDWNVIAGDFTYTGEPEYELNWAPATSERAIHSSVLGFEMTERAGGFALASQKPTVRTSGTWTGYSSVYLKGLGSTHDPEMPLAETRFLETYGLANPVGTEWDNFKSSLEQEWVLEIPRSANFMPMWNLPGKTIRFNIYNHPVFGTDTETLAIESVEVTHGAPTWTIRAT